MDGAPGNRRPQLASAARVNVVASCLTAIAIFTVSTLLAGAIVMVLTAIDND
jgi:hypothetical protein